MNDEHWDADEAPPLVPNLVPDAWLPWLILGAFVLVLFHGCN